MPLLGRDCTTKYTPEELAGATACEKRQAIDKNVFFSFVF